MPVHFNQGIGGVIVRQGCGKIAAADKRRADR
jgi:hypothetical protein